MQSFEMFGKMEVEVHFLLQGKPHRISTYTFIPIRRALCPPTCDYCKLNCIANCKFNKLNTSGTLARSAVLYNKQCCCYGFYIIKHGIWTT